MSRATASPGRMSIRALSALAALLACLSCSTAASAAVAAKEEFALGQGTLAGAIAWGPDGNLWFTEAAVDRVGRISPGG